MYEVDLAHNEFNDYNDYFGLFEQDVEPYNFLSIENIQQSSTNLAGIGLTLPPIPNTNLTPPYSEINFSLSQNKRLIERHAYTFMTLVGDIGGFTGAIIGLPAYFLSWYSNRMFTASIYEEMPVNDRKDKNKKRRQNNQRKI